ncbi:MAG: hypothetical protein COC16_04995 [Lutibacter sp.]|nr:MAG: hypothetical protein COC16_04995 [Lutibacter sp.]
MNKANSFTLIILLVLTITASVISNSSSSSVVMAILGVASLKFIGVAFQFMELKKAHIFWKSSLLFFLTLFSILIWAII